MTLAQQQIEALHVESFGYLLVHFVEDQIGHAEKIYFSLSIDDDPLRWRRLGDGPILESTQGSTGVRDPHLVRGSKGRFFLVATDLRVWRPEGPDWWAYRHRGSRDLVVWESDDLVRWSAARYVTVAPEGAGMAWAPESLYDPVSGDFLVYWSSGLLEDEGEGDLQETGPSRIMVARTRDFRTFSTPATYLELPVGVIDMTVHVTSNAVHRIAKQDDAAAGSLHVFHQMGSSFFADDFVTVASDIGEEIAPNVEGPLIFKQNNADRWYLWVDQYTRLPQGYSAFRTTDLSSGDWTWVPDFDLPANTKHGAVLPLLRHEYDTLESQYPESRQ